MPPSLTVRAFAEMLDLPMHAQLRILEEQKYPRQAPASYRVPYYSHALNAIRGFYESGSQAQALHRAIQRVEASGLPDSRIRNNVRVIRAFEQSRQARRNLELVSRRRHVVPLSGVEIRYSPDVAAEEQQRNKFILYNFRQARVGPELAARTLELVCWVLQQSSTEVDLAELEYVDLADRGRVHRVQRVRQQTIRRAQQNARAIAQIWQGI